ncbi:hypothetical protein HHI36_010885 [Cryptolaemus montrouzieri]|uniref:Uncharacterized protein n=1 Tax=Cryptolaemus montrouzieri TaxID=559131 RepID=A0ABD2MJZ8_9CUCU
MWISTFHIVIVYFCAYAITAEIRLKFEQNHRKSVAKRSVGSYNYYKKFDSHKYSNSLNIPKLRHQSRFPNLDKVMTRINSMKFGSVEHNEKGEMRNKLRHSWYDIRTTTTTPKTDEVFEHYFDDDYENDKEDDNWFSLMISGHLTMMNECHQKSRYAY